MSRPSSRKAYGSAMALSIGKNSNRFGLVSVDGRPAQNHAWPSLESVNVLHEVLRAYDKYYNLNI